MQSNRRAAFVQKALYHPLFMDVIRRDFLLAYLHHRWAATSKFAAVMSEFFVVEAGEIDLVRPDTFGVSGWNRLLEILCVRVQRVAQHILDRPHLDHPTT